MTLTFAFQQIQLCVRYIGFTNQPDIVQHHLTKTDTNNKKKISGQG